MVGMEDPAGNRKGDARRVMVVADPTRESAAALQYALGHAIIEKDELILIHVTSPCPKKGTFSSHLSTFFRKHQLNSLTPIQMILLKVVAVLLAAYLVIVPLVAFSEVVEAAFLVGVGLVTAMEVGRMKIF